MAKNNMVAHFEGGTSDKVYIASVRLDGGRGWTVIGKFGRRGKTMQASVKLSGASEAEARAEQAALFGAKLRAGYKDIQSAAYRGPVSMADVRAYLEPEVGQAAGPAAGTATKRDDVAEKAAALKAEKEAREAKAAKADDLEGMVAVCLDNNGLVEGFDVGVEYVFEPHADKEMLWVYDRFGERKACFRERFKLVEET